MLHGPLARQLDAWLRRKDFAAGVELTEADALAPDFLDNTDPDGFQRTFDRLGPHLGETLVIVTSKSGGTPETRNGMLAAREGLRAAGLDLARQAVAITQEGSALDRQATAEGWLARFPMWDWVGGRTSETSAVGLLPAALQGIDVTALLEGARACDASTRVHDLFGNPAALLATSWLRATGGRGGRAMVVLPYKDRLLLFSRYLQQLVMESLGKEKDLDGKVVHQGIAVYGNKGSTDQHAYVQQLRDGVPNFFVTFIEVLSFLSRPVSHSVRLFANMLAGHITLKVFGGFVTMLGALGFLAVLAAWLGFAAPVTSRRLAARDVLAVADAPTAALLFIVLRGSLYEVLGYLIFAGIVRWLVLRAARGTSREPLEAARPALKAAMDHG